LNTDAYRLIIWKHLVAHNKDLRLAWKGHGRTPWRYSTIGEHTEDREDYGNFNHRAVLPNEVVVDYDCPGADLEGNVVHTIKRISEHKYDFALWRTNGESDGGAHLHTYWNIPEKISNRQLMKEIIIEHLTAISKDDWKTAGIDGQLAGTHLIRAEGGKYEKKPPWESRRKELIHIEGKPLAINEIPQEVWSRYTGLVLKERLRTLRKSEAIPLSKTTPPSIKFILSDKFKDYRDGGKRALFVLASYFRKMPDDKLWALLHDFNRYNLRTPMDDNTIKATIKSVREHKGSHVGEPYRKNLLRSIGAYKEVYGDET
jgi:hypothetical protein